jgi:hypothetical protein
MPYRGYLELGGRELANSARLFTYARALMPGAGFDPKLDIANLALALGDEDYANPGTDNAPWVDSSIPESIRFLGAHALSITGAEDSTRTADSTENIGNGGSIGAVRYGTRQVRVKLLMLALDDLAMEAGMAWLKGTLDPDACGLHGASCGGADLCYFAGKPVIVPGAVRDEPIDRGEIFTYYAVGAGDPDIIFDPSPFYPFGGARVAAWNVNPGTDGASVLAAANGVSVQYGALELDSPDVIEESPVIYLRRQNEITNPRFAFGTAGWTPTSGTITAETYPDGSTGAKLDATSPATYTSNWLPDPSFEHGDPVSFGWRSTTPGGVTQVSDGTAPKGTHVAVVPAVTGRTELETTMLGPFNSGTGALGLWRRHNEVVTLTVFDNLGTQLGQYTAAAGADAWTFISFPGIPIGRGYVIRLTTPGAQELRVDGFILTEAGTVASSDYFDGDTAGAGSTTYYFAPDPSGPSRKRVGAPGSYEVRTPTAVQSGPAILSISARTDVESTLTLGLYNSVDDTLISQNAVTLAFDWARYPLNAVVPQGVYVKITGTGPAHVTMALLEVGSSLLPYFDGASVAPTGYMSSWVGAPNASPSRQDYTLPLETNRDDADWRAFFRVLSGELAEVDLFYGTQSPIDPADCVAPYERRLHDVVAISGPSVNDDRDLGPAGVMRVVDFILESANAFIYSNTKEVPLPDELETALYSDAVRNLATNPSGEEGIAGWALVPAGGTVTLTNPVATTPYGTHVLRSTWSVASTAAGGGATTDLAVVEGYPYYVTVNHVLASIATRLQVSIDWYDGVTFLSSTLGDVVAAGAGSAVTLAVHGTAPDGATIGRLKIVSVAGTGYANWSIGSYLEIDGVMATFGSAAMPYFDGDTAGTTAWVYSWAGTAGASASVRTPYVPDYPSELIDPSLPPIPDPPSPPYVANPAVANQPTDWLRYYADIPADKVAGWSVTVPTLGLSTGSSEARFVRVRFYPNPFGYAADEVDPLSYCSEFIVTYEPELTTLTVDGVAQKAFAEISGGPAIPADQQLYATDGSPITYPELSCGLDHVITFDVPPSSSLDNLGVALRVTRRE